jgi:rhamnosyltransferase
MNETPRFALIIPTLDAGELWSDVLQSISIQSRQPDQVLIVDSGSSDDTKILAEKYEFDTLTIERNEFDHALTRDFAIKKLSSPADIVIFMTQDVVLKEADAFKNLLAPFSDSQVAFSFGRQVVHDHAPSIEKHARMFNYPPESYKRSWQDKNQYGIKTVFCSNAFGAIRLSAFHEVGGYAEPLPASEDTYICAKLLKKGYKLAYAADAVAYHTHLFSVLKECKRYFRIGQFHANQPWILKELGAAEGEGARFVKSEINYLFKNQPLSIPYALLRTITKFLGFKLAQLTK